jgi:lipopolysaccharide biosynthesis glycosyltransferase
MNTSGYFSDITMVKSPKNISIVCAADDNYAMPLAVMLRSAIDNLDPKACLDIYVLDGGIREVSKQLVKQSLDDVCCYKIKWLQLPQSSYDWAVPIEHLSKAAYLRLMIADLLPKDLEKVIYLDCDIIVQSDLVNLWNIDIKSFSVAAVQSAGIPFVSSPRGVSRYSELGIPEDSKYFNSGVLLINLLQWRADDIACKAIEYIKHFGHTLVYADQDVLNALLASKWKELDNKWNQELPYLFEADSIQNAYIVHYISKNKPWQVPSHRKDADELFLSYLAKTKWSRKTIKLRLSLEIIRKRRASVKFLRNIKKRILISLSLIKQKTSDRQIF